MIIKDKTIKKRIVLHVATHLGGGVGRVLLSYFSIAGKESAFEHRIACLNYTEPDTLTAIQSMNLSFTDMMKSDKPRLLRMIAEADIVIIHWWNHPLLYDFLVRERLPENRMIIWSHVAGFHPPNVLTRKIIEYPDVFVFTTPISMQSKVVRSISDKKRENLRVIWSTIGLTAAQEVRPRKHKGFNVGYVGTVDYAKLHPDFLNICAAIDVPGVRFIVCGGSNEENIRKEAENLGIAEKFQFTGWVPNVIDYLSVFDVFGYPLAPDHYGTCDQALQEAMAAGIVPVVFGNRMERFMVRNGVTGIIAKSKNDYICAIQTLYKDIALRNSLSRNARRYALQNFSAEKMMNDWEWIFEEVFIIPKTSKKWPIKREAITGSDVFLESLGDHQELFLEYRRVISEKEKLRIAENIATLGKSPLWQSESKGTVHNYNSFLPGDKYLSLWSDLMKRGIEPKR